MKVFAHWVLEREGGGEGLKLGIDRIELACSYRNQGLELVMFYYFFYHATLEISILSPKIGSGKSHNQFWSEKASHPDVLRSSSQIPLGGLLAQHGRLQSSAKVLGRLLLSFFPSFPRPWQNVEQNVNVCAHNCSVISQHWTQGYGGYLKRKFSFFED